MRSEILLQLRQHIKRHTLTNAPSTYLLDPLLVPLLDPILDPLFESPHKQSAPKLLKWFVILLPAENITRVP